MISRVIKKILTIIKKRFVKVEFVNNYIYKENLLENRTALITGGTSGIGLSIAKMFLLNGCNIIITGRNKKKIDIVVKELSKMNKNKKIYGFEFDISKTDKIQEQFLNIKNNINNLKIDILVNNAGIIKGESIIKTKIEEYEDCMKTNLEGTYFLSQTFLEYMIENKLKGNVLNILSSSSIRPAVNPYAISKWGEKGLTLGMAKKFIKYGIVVNGIAPGPTYTSMLISDNQDKNIYLDSSPCKRYVMPEEIANAAAFLVSDCGKMVVGDILYMTGGAGIITLDDINY